MKRTRVSDENYNNIAYKKIEYVIKSEEVNNKRIYRCNIDNCKYISCTPHNLSQHINAKHNTDVIIKIDNN